MHINALDDIDNRTIILTIKKGEYAMMNGTIGHHAGRRRLAAAAWFGEGVGWRWRELKRRVRPCLGIADQQWARVVMDRETDHLMRELDRSVLDAVEISGTKWRDFGFASYRSLDYAEYDLCARPFAPEAFDVVIAEQVLEHVLWPYRAVRHAWQMLRPGGVFLVTTPFLVRVHAYPTDCSRWTPLGLKHLLAEGGFGLDDIESGSWGNRSCIRANFKGWPNWVRWKHSLRNEPDFPVVVWALARKVNAPLERGS
jgi:SAM-dependent methyltransferase